AGIARDAGGSGGGSSDVCSAVVGAGQGDVGGDLLAVGGGGRAEVAVGGRAADAVGGDDPVAGALGLHRAAADGRRVGAVIGLVEIGRASCRGGVADVGGGRGGGG